MFWIPAFAGMTGFLRKEEFFSNLLDSKAGKIKE
jgi:hypothetical protein